MSDKCAQEEAICYQLAQTGQAVRSFLPDSHAFPSREIGLSHDLRPGRP
jgi:hypothetical protein